MTINAFTCICALSLSGMAIAQDQVSAGGRPLRMTQIPPQKMGLNAVDSQAIRDIAYANMLEIKSSELALSRADSEWARQYAKEMIQEHTGAQNELRTLAANKGVNLPQSLPSSLSSKLRALSNARGSRFDSMYRALQLEGHRMTEMKLRKAMASGRDADVRGLEVKLLPSVVMHRRLAVMKQTMMGPTQHNGNKA
jgi:putative membrane protein